MNSITSSDLVDPAIALAERRLALLGELALIAMEVSRAYAAAAVAAAHAVEVILADEHWQPETGRARALAGARDAADGFQKVSRVLRLTLKLEAETAEALQALRAGVSPAARRIDAGGTQAEPGGEGFLVGRSLSEPTGRVPSGGSSDDETREADRRDADCERLVEFDRTDRLPHAPFRETVDGLCGDLGVAADWTTWSVGPPAVKYRPLAPRPPSLGECRPPGTGPECEPPKGAELSSP